MNSKKELVDYLSPSAKLRIATWILLGITIVSIVLGISLIGQSIVVFLFLAAFMAGLTALIMLFLIISQSITAKRCMNDLAKKDELDNAAAEVGDPSNEIIGKDQVRFKRRFIFSKNRRCSEIRGYKMVLSSEGFL